MIDLADIIINGGNMDVSGLLNQTANGAPRALVFIFLMALVISMLVIPLMMRLAPILGMLDQPARRKIHRIPIARVGGVGIVFGAVISSLLWIGAVPEVLAYLYGAIILFAFGLWDDVRDIGYLPKFIGQIVAVAVVVYYGDVYITRLPFAGMDIVDGWFGRPFTVLVLVGVINALNTSDGLDGLAGGESLLSFMCLAYLAYVSGSVSVLAMSIAAAGGIVGFLRYNSHPARVFMGDNGSQFLGYTLGFLAVLLTQKENTAMSPLVGLFIIGLPIIDLFYVIAQRNKMGISWFRPTRGHIHHRLLDMGFHHYESVVIIYSLQSLIVLFAVMYHYESDLLLLLVYLTGAALIYLFLNLAVRYKWSVRTSDRPGYLKYLIGALSDNQLFQKIANKILYYSISAYLVAGSMYATSIPPDFGGIAASLGILMLLGLSLERSFVYLPLRLLVYVTIAFIVYLVTIYQPEQFVGADPFTYIFYGVITAAVVLLIRINDTRSFQTTPMDYLVVLMVIMIGILTRLGAVDSVISALILKIVILFYGSEIILSRMHARWNVFTSSVLLSLAVLGYRGFVSFVV